MNGTSNNQTGEEFKEASQAVTTDAQMRRFANRIFLGIGTVASAGLGAYEYAYQWPALVAQQATLPGVYPDAVFAMNHPKVWAAQTIFTCLLLGYSLGYGLSRPFRPEKPKKKVSSDLKR
ncbi:MAG: hypothetical protein PHE27_02590 [Alphaproteobacteria bacterium]|nr:hypothetical protein [Alphaproteobacteria bacterium]